MPPPTVLARIRQHGLSQDDAKTAYAGTGHGLAYLAGLTTYSGYQLAERYARLRLTWQGLVSGGPKEATSAAIPYVHDRLEASADGDAHFLATFELPEDRERRVRHQWEIVVARFSYAPKAHRALNDVAVRGWCPKGNEKLLADYIRSLEMLSELWGVGEEGVTPKRR